MAGRAHRWLSLTALPVTAVLLLAAAGCARPLSGPRRASANGRPDQIIPGPAQAISMSAPTGQGMVWILAGDAAVKTLHLIDLASRSLEAVAAAPASAVAVAAAQNGWLGVGTATPTTGALQLWSERSRRVLASIPVSGPVLALAAAGSQFFVLTGTAATASVAVVDATTRRVVATVPAPAGAVAVTPARGGRSVWVLRSDGVLDEIELAGGAVSVQFGTGSGGVARALATNGTSLYILKSRGNVSVVAAVNIATESVTKLLPAPASTVDLVLSPAGQTLYDLVGTAAVGNLQAFRLNS